jgi:thioredoxin-like negative regulator of GroEL
MGATYIKTTLDGRRVAVIDGWICLGGAREADALIPMDEHPNRQAILKAVPGASHAGGRLPFTLAEAAMVQGAMSQAQRVFDASPSGITQRLRHAVWAKATADGVD